MKIKVTKILKANAPYTGVSKTTGKPYTIYSYTAAGEIEGVACDLLTVKTMSEEIANKIQACGEFAAEPSEYKGEVSYMVRGDKPAYTGGYKGGAKYQPRVYLSGKQFHALCAWVKKIADELYPNESVHAFDKIMGCASVLLDMSKYADKPAAEKPAEPKPAEAKPDAKPTPTPIRMATAADIQSPAGDAFESSDVPF